MPLVSGDALGPYEVLSAIGAGGMGEVYKARDTRLGRTVAVKVLPQHIAKREDARARFEREARAVASLNHPNICTLHDIGPNYMVLELIEGETLAARIEKGPIPLDQALRFAIQIADAIDRAHRAGVTHRDIKPQNIMLTRDGVKVLDFGLAKSTSAPASSEATLTNVLTTEGAVLGTPQYMAPEQFAGKEADARSDIWAFGSVLYEMVTGQKAFQGKTYTTLVGAILAADPPPMAVKPFTPSWLERLVRRCLQKDPDDRYQSMRDVVLELKSPISEPAAAPARTPRWPFALAVAAVVAAAVFAVLWLRSAAEPAPVAILEVSPPPGVQLTPLNPGGGAAISPDGRTLAFVATSEKGEQGLYVRPLDSPTARLLPEAADAARPFWSPDSKYIAFVDARRRLKRIDARSGVAQTICTVPGTFRSGSWSEKGDILFDYSLGNGILHVPSSGGAPQPVTIVNREDGEIRHSVPRFLPGGDSFIYQIQHKEAAAWHLAVRSLKEEPTARGITILDRSVLGAAYDAASGHLLFVGTNSTLVAQRLSLRPPRLEGDPVVIAEGVRAIGDNGIADFSVSRNGMLFYSQASRLNRVRFQWRDRSGQVLQNIGEPVATDNWFELSPDNKRLAFGGFSLVDSDISVLDVESGAATRITFNGATFPHWSRDGKYLYYNTPAGIHRRAADGSGSESLVWKTSYFEWVRAISPDGKTLLFGANDILRLPLTGDAKPEPYLNESHREILPAFSPDGRWIAYVSNETGRYEVYIQGFPDKRGKWLITTTGGMNPVWRQDGRELYWSALDKTLYAANVELTADNVRVGRPQPLFRQIRESSFFSYQVSNDGQRFIVWAPEFPDQDRRPMVVVQNWTAKLNR